MPNTTPSPTPDEVREARAKLQAYVDTCNGTPLAIVYSTILTALAQAQGEVKRLSGRVICSTCTKFPGASEADCEPCWRDNYAQYTPNHEVAALRADLSKSQNENARLASELADKSKGLKFYIELDEKHLAENARVAEYETECTDRATAQADLAHQLNAFEHERVAPLVTRVKELEAHRRGDAICINELERLRDAALAYNARLLDAIKGKCEYCGDLNCGNVRTTFRGQCESWTPPVAEEV